MKAGVLAEPVLVGREREIEDLETFLNSAVEGKGKTVFISGEAGSGKSRLIREFLNVARQKGVAVMAGWCLSDSATPYFPFVEAFNSYFVSVDEEEQPTNLGQLGTPLGLRGAGQVAGEERGITAWLTGPRPAERTGKLEVVSPHVWKDQVFAGVAKTLHSVSVQEPIILFIEDIHWADSASLALLHYVARAVNNSERILVLATFRSEELTADAEGHPHPLAEALRMMRREDLFTEIKLSSLDQANVSKIAENMMGGSLQPKLAEKLTAESRGNPLFVVESLRMLHERRSLVQEDNQWHLAVDELGIPSKIKDIILRRLSVLKYSQRRVLDAASVIGEKFDVELLSTVLGLDSLEVLETLNVIAHSTSLVSVEESCYRFDHARSRETLYEELSAPLKRGYHGRIAEKLESTKDGTLPLSDLAYHFAQAGNKEKSLKYALAAAKDELARFSNSQAIKHFAYALQSIPEGPGHAEEKRIALEGLGDAYAANNMYGEAIKTFDELAASDTGAVRLRALRKAMDAAFLKGDKPEILIEYAKKAEELAIYDRLEMARVLDNRGRSFGYAGRGSMKMDRTDYDAALKIFKEENSLADAADALWRSGAVDTFYNDSYIQGLAKLLLSVAIFREIGDVYKEVEATLYLGGSYSYHLLIPESVGEDMKVLRMGEKIGCFGEMAQAISRLAIGSESEGKFEEAISMQMKALEYSRKTDLSWLESKIYGELIILYMRLGDIEKAEEYDEKLSKMSPETVGHVISIFPVVAGEAMLSAAKDQWQFDPSEVRKKLPDFFAEIPSVDFFLRVSHSWFLQKQGKVEEANIQFGEAMKIMEHAQQKVSHANVQAHVMVQRKAEVGEELEMRLDILNVSRRPASLTKVEGILTTGFNVGSVPAFCSLQNGVLDLKGKTINPFSVETIKLKLKAAKAGTFTLNPAITYIDDQGQTKTAHPAQITLTVQVPKPTFEVQPGRITTGYAELDRLLLGGIPEGYAMALAAPSSDETALLVRRFLEAGVEACETTFQVTVEAGSMKDLANDFQDSFYLFVCNPQADTIVQTLPNIFKLKGIENLTEIDIALTKAFRALKPSQVGHKRICLELLSDILLQHHIVNTRRWLSALLPTLKSKGFTILAVVDSQIHSREELQAVLAVFEGEIRVSEKETLEGTKQTLKIRKLYNHKYLDNEIILSKENLSA